MPRRQDNPYAPHDWAPHEKPALLGSPSTPLHSPAKRLAYGVVGLLVCLTGALGNAVVTANLQLLQGTFAAWSTEIAWLPSGIRDDQRLHQPAAGEIPPAVWPARFHRRLSGALCAGHLFPPLRQRSQLSDDGSRRPWHGGRGAQLAGDLLPGTGLACAPSPERADYRHHSARRWPFPWRASFPPNCCRPMNGAVSTSLSWAWRWCRWPASSR